MSSTGRPRSELARTFTAPGLLALVSATGLVAALIGEGALDLVAGIGVAAPLAAIAWAWSVRACGPRGSGLCNNGHRRWGPRSQDAMAIRFIRRMLGGWSESTPAKSVGLEPGKQPESPYRAIGIWPGEPSCRGAREIAPLRFLYRSAPHLPLPECDQAECHCTYSHYSDRRSGADRRSVLGTLPSGMPERRSGLDRRHSRQP